MSKCEMNIILQISLQAKNATVGHGSVVGRVNGARDSTATVTTQLNAVEGDANLLHNRTMVANNVATAAHTKEKSTFDSATHMLDIMKNFDARAARK